MPTSSIFANFDIIDRKTAEAFVDALEASAKDPEFKLTVKCKMVTDPEEIKGLFKRRKIKQI